MTRRAPIAEIESLPSAVATNATGKEWVIRTPASFDDARVSPYSRTHRDMLRTLEYYCRDKAYCWVGNAEIAARYGCKERRLQQILLEMGSKGLKLIHAEIDESGRHSRVGIILRKRVDPDLPVAESDEELRDTIDLLKARRQERANRTSGVQETAPKRVQETAPKRVQETAPELRPSSKQDEPNNDAGLGEESPSRQRHGDQASDASPTQPATLNFAPPSGTTPAPRVAPPVPAKLPIDGDGPIPTATTIPIASDTTDLTAGQREFLGGLTDGQRARFDGMSKGRRAQMLDPFARGFDPLMARMHAAELGRAAPPPPPPAEASLPEMIEALASPGSYAGVGEASRVARALMLALDDENAAQFEGPVRSYCEGVAKRHRTPDSLIVPFEKTMKALSDGVEIKNKAAYWMRSVGNYDREHTPPAFE